MKNIVHKSMCVIAAFAVLAPANAAERIITIDAVFAKDIFQPFAFGSTLDELPLNIEIVIDDETPGIAVVSGTDLALVPLAAVTSLTATIGDGTWGLEDLQEQPFFSLPIFYAIAIDGPPQNGAGTRVGLFLRDFSVGEIQLIDFDSTLLTLTGVGSGSDFINGAGGQIYDVEVTFSTAELSAPEQIADLKDEMMVLGLNDALIDSIYAEDDANKGEMTSAVNKLQAFIGKIEAQRGKKLTDTQADDLIARAQAIIAVLQGT